MRKPHIDLVDPGIQSRLDVRVFNHTDHNHDFYGGDDSRSEVASQGGDPILNDRRSREMSMNFCLTILSRFEIST